MAARTGYFLRFASLRHWPNKVKAFDHQRNAMPNYRRLKTALFVVVARSL